MALSAILDAILDYAVQQDPAIRQHMQAGYDHAAIQRIVPFELPAEVVELYQWHNGTSFSDDDPWRYQLFFYHTFLPLEAAYQTYQDWMQVNKEKELGFEGFNPHLFPLFTFMGEYYSVWVGEPSHETGAVYFVLQGEGKVYESLTTMLSAILECYETGAYTIKDGDVVVDEKNVAAIKAKWNPCRLNGDGPTLHEDPYKIIHDGYNAYK